MIVHLLLLFGHSLHLLRHAHILFSKIGGSDQWGNITAGIELIRKLTGTSQDSKISKAFGVTLPLITNSSGEKFGKSAGNAVWMENNKTSFFNFYQFFVRIPDLEVEKLLRLYTFLPLEQIDDVLKEHAVSPRPFVPIQTRVHFFLSFVGMFRKRLRRGSLKQHWQRKSPSWSTEARSFSFFPVHSNC